MLSVTSGHALRALTYLARLPEGASMLGRELAGRSRIPANYLSKILGALGHAGIIDATRGNGGGYRLRRAPGEIYLFEIVGLFDRERDCDPCAAHEAWRNVRATYRDFLHHTTLADISRAGGFERGSGFDSLYAWRWRPPPAARRTPPVSSGRTACAAIRSAAGA